MTEPNYTDIVAMQKVVDEKDAKQAEEFHAAIKAMNFCKVIKMDR